MNRKSLFFFICCLLSGMVVPHTVLAFRPLEGITIMLDPGHGGSDPGAVGPTGLKESETNLRVARYLGKLLVRDGAKVLHTREDDRFLALADRVAMAKKERPDLFVSIHHNASLTKLKDNRGEIYFNALDRGIPMQIGKEMTEGLAGAGMGSASHLLPGGFFVLRNNPVPSVLTEASYISIPEVEKTLKSGRTLTAEAQVFRMAIRRAFKAPPLRVEIMTNDPVVVNTPYFLFLCLSDGPIQRMKVRVNPVRPLDLNFEKVPTLGHVYRLFNSRPIPSGDYTLQFTFFGQDGRISPMQTLPVKVQLPTENSVVMPVAPYIPVGFKGAFPLHLVLKDAQGRVNEQGLPFVVQYGQRSMPGLTRPDGKALILLPLNGSERGNIDVSVTIGQEVVARTTVPIQVPQKVFILGRVSCSQLQEGLEKTRIRYGKNRFAVTTTGGFFFCELPLIFRNLSLEITPPLGYDPETRWVRSEGQMVLTPQFVFAPRAKKLLGKRVGLFAPRAMDAWARPLVRELMACGVKIVRLHNEPQDPHPERTAATHANTLGNLDLVVSLKGEDTPQVSFRHYYKGGKGQKIAKSAAALLQTQPGKGPQAKVGAGSDYELGHTAATCLVIGTPLLSPPDLPERLAGALTAALWNTM